MKEENKFLGCYVSVTHPYPNSSQELKDLAAEQGKLFDDYIWGEIGVSPALKKLRKENYGNDIDIILFQFYVNPIAFEIQSLKEIESYRKNEKSIGIPVIINDENFFSKSETERYQFLKDVILYKMSLLTEVVRKKKLDTNMDLLKSDLQKILEEI